MAFVVDASIAASWWLPDETHDGAYALLRRLGEEPGVAPMLWWYEVRNLLLISERRGRIDAVGAQNFLADLAVVNIEIDSEPESAQLVSLARRHALTAYDAAYIELATRKRVPLATLDRKLVAAAGAEGIAVLPA